MAAGKLFLTWGEGKGGVVLPKKRGGMRNMNNGLCLPGFFLPLSLSYNLSFPKDVFCSFSNICVLSFFGKMPQQNHSFLFPWVIDCFVWPETKAFLWLYRIRNIFRTSPTHGFPQQKNWSGFSRKIILFLLILPNLGNHRRRSPFQKETNFVVWAASFSPLSILKAADFSSQWKQLYSTSWNLPTICWKKHRLKKSWLF